MVTLEAKGKSNKLLQYLIFYLAILYEASNVVGAYN